MKTRKKIIIIIVITLISVLVVIKSNSSKQKTNNKIIEKIVPVKTTKPIIQDITSTLTYTGDLKGQDEAYLYSKVNAKIINFTCKEGDKVKKGDVIAYIDRDIVGYDYQPATVETLLSGFIGRIYLDKGDFVEENKTQIAFIVDMDNVLVELFIPEEEITKIKKDLNVYVKFDAYPNEKFKATIDTISPVVDIKTRKFLCKIKIKNKEYKLKPGMFAICELVIEKHENAITVPVNALINFRNHSADIFINNNDIAKKIKVEIGIIKNDIVEILYGINKDNEIITLGSKNLEDGDKILKTV